MQWPPAAFHGHPSRALATRQRSPVGSMSGHRRRQWPGIEPTGLSETVGEHSPSNPSRGLAIVTSCDNGLRSLPCEVMKTRTMLGSAGTLAITRFVKKIVRANEQSQKIQSNGLMVGSMLVHRLRRWPNIEPTTTHLLLSFSKKRQHFSSPRGQITKTEYLHFFSFTSVSRPIRCNPLKSSAL